MRFPCLLNTYSLTAAYFSVYGSADAQTLRALGEADINALSIGGAAPYWRAAFEYNLGNRMNDLGRPKSVRVS
jgi:hypothetical protein